MPYCAKPIAKRRRKACFTLGTPSNLFISEANTMPILTINADYTPTQPWRNGGGTTRELLVWPTLEYSESQNLAIAVPPWQVRITLAKMDKNGVFSAFPGVQRWYSVAQGTGVILHMPNEVLTLHPGDAPLCYDGAITPACELIDGSTENLNIMAQQGQATMSVVQPKQSWSCQMSTMRGIFTTTPGTLFNGAATYSLPANTLHWDTQANTLDWQFEAAADTEEEPTPGARFAWWLGFSPAASTNIEPMNQN